MGNTQRLPLKKSQTKTTLTVNRSRNNISADNSLPKILPNKVQSTADSKLKDLKNPKLS